MKYYLITYSCQGEMGYATTTDIVEWLFRTSGYNDAPYYILNTIELTESEYDRINCNPIAGM